VNFAKDNDYMFSKVTSIKQKIVDSKSEFLFIPDLKTNNDICQLKNICIWLNLEN